MDKQAKQTKQTKQVRDFMTPNPVLLPQTASIMEAAQIMRDRSIGDVLVVDGDGDLTGIVTDRDIAIRVIAEGRDPVATRLWDATSPDPVTVKPTTPISEVMELMKDQAIRRLPVVDNGWPVGFLSLGDLAVALDRESVLGEVSAAPHSW